MKGHSWKGLSICIAYFSCSVMDIPSWGSSCKFIILLSHKRCWLALIQVEYRAVIKDWGPGILPSYFEIYPRLLWYKTTMLTSLQQLESPAIFCISPPTSKISDSPDARIILLPKQNYILSTIHPVYTWYGLRCPLCANTWA